MMEEFIRSSFVVYLTDAIFVYGLTVSLSYLILAILSAGILFSYIKKNRFIDYRTILSSAYAPSVSLIAPAYNEEQTIAENIRSLMSIHYNNFEIIIVNDGSKDKTLQTMIDAYDLMKVDFAFNQEIPGKPIRGIYKSTNKAYGKLLVIDKENGGKADALNAGINVASYNLITCIDVDCVLEQDAILKMVKPFMEEKKRVIATGGVIRIANSCDIEDGRLIKARAPENILARFQVVEYLRAFLMGRMGWSRINGLMLISGALGFFDKEIVKACGGYNHKTVGEDMELVMRMCRYMREKKEPYKIVYIPDPLCWTEAPTTNQILGRQRNRWMRGTMEALWMHRKMLFNPRYGVIGMISYPYWMLFEWLAPIVEFIGLIYFLILVILGYHTWIFFLTLYAAVYAFAIMMSSGALLFEELTYHQYNKKKDVFILLITLILEPFIFHPKNVWWSLKGNWDKMVGKGGWGEMTRTGFKKKTG